MNFCIYIYTHTHNVDTHVHTYTCTHTHTHMHTLPVHTPGLQFSLFECFRELGTISSSYAAGVYLVCFQVFQELQAGEEVVKKDSVSTCP